MFLVPDTISKQDGGGRCAVFWVKTDCLMGPFEQETLVCKQLSHSTNTFIFHGKTKCSIIIRIYWSLKYSPSCTQSHLEWS